MTKPWDKHVVNTRMTSQDDPARLSVLIVDDDPAALRMIAKITATAGYEVILAKDGQEALNRVLHGCPDMLITDWDMPGLDGVQLCRALRERELPFYVYVLLLTAKSQSQEMVVALNAGADDFISKPIIPAVLQARLKVGARTVTMERRLRHLGQSDPLTGALNRRAFYERLAAEWEGATRYDRHLSCVMLDLDFFKRLNDTFGHAAGDTSLQAVVNLLENQCRPTDVVARFGGEEFCVLLTETDEPAAVRWAERVRSALSEQHIPFHDHVLTISASFGVAALMPDTTAPEVLMDLADQALRVAKESGRNRVVAYSALADAGLNYPHSATAPDPWDNVSARDVMSPALYLPHQDETVAQVADVFLQLRINAAPVVDDGGRLIGIISENDLLGVAASNSCLGLPIRTCMKTTVVQYDETAAAVDVFRFLSRASVPRVVVVSQTRPTGVISRATLLRWLRNWSLSHPLSAVQSGRPSAPTCEVGILRATDAATDLLVAFRTQLAAADFNIVPCAVAEATRLEELAHDILVQCRGQDRL